MLGIGVLPVSNSKKYSWTTGPVSASEGFNNAKILILNNTSLTRKATIRLYDLSATPKKKVFDETFKLAPFETAEITINNTEKITEWEAQGMAFSKSVRFFIAGRDGDMNLPGNTVLNSQFKLFGS